MNSNPEGEWKGVSEAECNAMVRRLDNQDELIHHYKQRMRAMLPFVTHKGECAYSEWTVMEHLQKSFGTGYSAGPQPNCTCGAAALVAIVKAEVYDENGKPV